jgi:hypothetical protein
MKSNIINLSIIRIIGFPNYKFTTNPFYRNAVSNIFEGFDDNFCEARIFIVTAKTMPKIGS